MSEREQHLEHFIALFMAPGQFARREMREREREESGNWPISSFKLEIENFNASVFREDPIGEASVARTSPACRIAQ